MKRIVLYLLLLLPFFAHSQYTAKSMIYQGNGIGFYEFLPPGYSPTSTYKYPVIIFLAGQQAVRQGTDLFAELPELNNQFSGGGLPYHLSVGATMTFTTPAGVNEAFIVLVPQKKQQWDANGYEAQYQPFYIDAMLSHAAGLNYDPNRVFLTGLSLGAGQVWDYPAYSAEHAKRILGIAPASGQPVDAMAGGIADVCNIARGSVGVRALMGSIDFMRQTAEPQMNYYNQTCAPNPAGVMELFDGHSHNQTFWNMVYDPKYNNPKYPTTDPRANIYQWMLSLKKAGTPTPNILPVANAGGNQTITLPANSVNLSGAASSDPDGSIVSYSWTKTAGPSSFTIVSPSSVNTTVNNLVQGTYTFQLTVTDNRGGTASASVTVVVNAAPNQPPVANAGPFVSITLPTNSTTLNGSGSDPDGWITAYAWSKIDGPAQFNIVSPSAASTGITNLVQGTYTFRLTVTDNSGATAFSNVTVTVNPAPNQPPVANAGPFLTITLPTNSTTLNGSGSDPDGWITAYAWSKIDGPAQFNIVSPAAASTGITNLVQGTYTFRLTVTDNSGATAFSNVTVTVNPAPNQPPVANAGPSVSITLPTNSTTLNGSGSDPDGWISSYSWSKIGGPTQFNIVSPSSASTGISNLVEGIYTFKLTVTDNSGATASANVSVSVYAAPPPPNQLPSANAGAPVSITLPANSTQLNGSGSDPDGTITSYAWSKTGGPTQFNIVSPSSASTWVNNLVEGIYTFKLTVTDNSGATASSNVTVTVNAAPNQPPVANAGAPVSITLPTNSTTLNGSGSDPDGSIAGYSWSKIGGPTQFNIVSPSTASTGINNLVEGIYTFKLTVTDNKGATASSNVSVTVYAAPPPPNQPPVANAGAAVSITLPANSAQLFGSGTDADGTITGYAWSKIGGPSQFNIVSPSTASTWVNNLVEGIYTFKLTVTDNNGATASSNVTVTVNAAAPAPNQLPVANAGAPVSITLPTNFTNLNGSASSDPDGSIVGYNWTKISGPSSFSIASPTTANTSVTNLVEGIYTFSLSVTDNRGGVSSASVSVTVNAATPPPGNLPVANAGKDFSITLPYSGFLDGSGSSAPAGSIVSYSWTKIAGPSAYNLVSPNASGTFLNSVVEGYYTFRLTIKDNNGSIASDDVVVTVLGSGGTPPPPPPPPPPAGLTVSAGPDLNVVLPYSAFLNGSASSTTSTIVSYNWTKVSGPAAYNLVSPTSVGTFLNSLAEGYYTFRLTVTDNNGSIVSDDVLVTVSGSGGTPPPPPPPPPPSGLVVSAGADQKVELPYSTFLNGSASSTTSTIVSYNWTKVSGPASFNLVSPTSVGTFLNSLAEGIYTFRLTVKDNNGSIASDDVVITVYAAGGTVPPPPPPPPPSGLVANAGADVKIELPYSGFLNGSGSSTTSTIVSYNWSKISGPAAYNLVSPTSAGTFLNSVTEGVYTFRLTVKDNNGSIATDDVVVTVYGVGGTPPPPPPPPTSGITVSAGPDVNLSLPYSAFLNGSASSTNSTIVSYSWSKIAGPASYNLVSPTSAGTFLNSLAAGIYTFRLTVKDDLGAIASDDVVVNVSAAATITASNSTLVNQPIDGLIFQKVSVYPNPVVDMVNINWKSNFTGKGKLSFLDISGKVVKMLDIRKEKSEYSISIPLHSLKPGIYLLQIRTDNGRLYTQQLLKQ